MREFLMKIHHKIVDIMAKSWIVEHLLIAKVRDDDGEIYDCIYCTILRNAVLFAIIGLIFGYFLGCAQPLPV